MSFIECENLVKIYQIANIEVVALQGIDLHIDQGEMMAIIGASGSGKSTLMNILGGLDKPSAGQVRVGKYNLKQMTRREQVLYRRREVGFVWQQTARNLVPYLTALENVEMPMALNGMSGKERRERAQKLLAQVGLADRMDHRPNRLSGGQQQRVAIAVSMANYPSLLLADEPTGQVDSEAANAIFDAMRTLNQEYNVTIMIVTHDHNVAKRVDRVLGMRDGHFISEVLRQRSAGGQSAEAEYAILDRGGRVQIPQEYLDMLGLKERVQVQLQDGRLVIYPESESGEVAV